MTFAPHRLTGRVPPSRTLLRRLARLSFMVCVLAIAWLAFTPQPDVPGLGWDKLNHAAAFLVLAALAELGWPGRAALPWRLVLLLGYGLGIELVQSLLVYREASALDFMADALGIAAYLALRRAAMLVYRRGPGGAAGWADRAPRRRRLSPLPARAGRNAPAGSRRSPGG